MLSGVSVHSYISVKFVSQCVYRASGYTYSTRPSSAETFEWYHSAVCQWTPPPGLTTTFNFTYSTTLDFTSPPISTTTTNVQVFDDSTDVVNAYGVEIRWQSTDFHSVPATAIATTTAASAEVTKGSGEESSGLSPGAKVGTGVGVAVGVVIFLVLGFFILRRRKPQGDSHDASRDPYVPLADEPIHTHGKAELPATRPGNFIYHKPELASKAIFEKEGSSKIDQKHELGSAPVFEKECSSSATNLSHKPVELEGSSTT